jgi:hypothetical protein
MKIDIAGFAKRHKVLVALFIVAVGLVGWWKHEFPSATWRYKMTVTVETPEGIRTGSAVREVRQYTDVKIGDVGGGNAYVRGEAVVVDLGYRGKLFMTVGEDHYFLFRVFPFSKGGNTPEGIAYYSHLKNAKASILGLENAKPQLVTFTDLNNPLTVKAVDQDNLSATFGMGIKLKDITAETTDEPMTSGIIDAVLPWLKGLQQKEARLNGNTSIAIFTNDLADNLGVGSFKTGVKK